MKYDFDEIIDRQGSDALKVEALLPRWKRSDLLPLWVADMDFRTPEFITEAIVERCTRGILGYTIRPDRWYSAISEWLLRRYGWAVSKEMINFSPGVVQGLAFALKCFTSKRDKILIQPPVYHPFRLICLALDREVVDSPLLLVRENFTIDFEDFRNKIRGCKAFILCNPHNPGGRVWSLEELTMVADICWEEGVLVLSDEIHADLTFPGFKFTPFASVSERAARNSLSFMAPSKAFNIPGLSSSYIISENSELSGRFRSYLESGEFDTGHSFSFICTIAAYEKGEEWLSEALSYIEANISFLENFLKQNIPPIKAIRPQASFLVFMDCRALGLKHAELLDLFIDKAKLALNDGAIFGKEGEGFMRINAACPRSVLGKALNQLQVAYIENFVNKSK